MLELHEHGALVERFDVAKPDYAVHADHQAEIIRNQSESDQAGLKSGSVASIHKSSAAASKDARDAKDARAERKSRQQYEDAMLLALLDTGDLDTYVAENIFGGMSDGEIMDVVAMIEAESGMSIEDYARDILGDDMPDRAPGESDADYYRRLLITSGDVVLEDDLSIRPGFENDPLARFINGHEETRHAREVAAEADRIHADEGLEAATEFVRPRVDESYIAARGIGGESDVAELAAIGDAAQDEHSDDELQNESGVTLDSTGFLSGFPGSGGALEIASTDFSTQFETASAEPTEPTPNEPEPAPSMDTGIA